MKKYYETELGYIVNGDVLIVMDELVKSGVKFDAIIADIPQKITRNDWDRPIPLKPMWELLYKLIKNERTPIILFTNQPFTTDLKTETIKIYKEIQLKIKNTNILITHKPQNKNKRLFDINIHGHHHKKLLPKRFLQDYYYNVAVEHNYYKPKLLIDIIKNKGICTKGIDIDEIIGQILYNNKKNLVLA